MFSMFSPDSKIMQIIGRLTDLIELNILYLLTCLPVFTIGAATTALYTLCFQLMREEGGSVIRAYFRAFRNNFRQATAIWLVLMFIAGPALFYAHSLFRLAGILRFTALLFLLIAATAALTGTYVFPWISQFQNTVRQSLQNALILSITHLPRSLCILAIHLAPFALWIFRYELFQNVSFLWLALYFAAAAYLTTAILWNVFKPYRQTAV